MWQYCFSYFDICRQNLLLVLIEMRAEALASATSSWQGLSKAPGLTGLSVTSEWTQWTPWTAVRSSVIWSSDQHQHLGNIWSTSGQHLVNVNISLVILLSELVSGSYLGGRTGEELLILDLTARPHSQLTCLTGLTELQRPWTLYSCLIQDETEDASWSALSPVILKNSLNFTVYFCIFLYILVYFHYRLSTSLLLWQSWKVHCLYSWPWKVYSSE